MEDWKKKTIDIESWDIKTWNKKPPYLEKKTGKKNHEPEWSEQVKKSQSRKSWEKENQGFW